MNNRNPPRSPPPASPVREMSEPLLNIVNAHLRSTGQPELTPVAWAAFCEEAARFLATHRDASPEEIERAAMLELDALSRSGLLLPGLAEILDDKSET